MKLTLDEVMEFKRQMFQAPRSSCRKLSGQEMSRLKKSHFNEYIKKIKYYAKKDLDKITKNNAKIFYQNHVSKDYLNRQEPNNVIKKSKPQSFTQKNKNDFYSLGQTEISQMKRYIFLAEECYKLESRFKKVLQKSRNKDFVQKVQKVIQQSHANQSPKKSINLHLTVKSAINIDKMMRQRKSKNNLQRISRRSYESIPKSFSSTNFSDHKRNSSISIKLKM